MQSEIVPGTDYRSIGGFCAFCISKTLCLGGAPGSGSYMPIFVIFASIGEGRICHIQSKGWQYRLLQVRPRSSAIER